MIVGEDGEILTAGAVSERGRSAACCGGRIWNRRSGGGCV